MLTKGMRINTSRVHLLLQHRLQGFQVFEVRNVEMKRRVNAFLQNVVTLAFPTQCPPCYGCIASLGSAWTIFCHAITDTSDIAFLLETAKIGVKLQKKYGIVTENLEKVTFIMKKCQIRCYFSEKCNYQ